MQVGSLVMIEGSSQSEEESPTDSDLLLLVCSLRPHHQEASDLHRGPGRSGGPCRVRGSQWDFEDPTEVWDPQVGPRGGLGEAVGFSSSLCLNKMKLRLKVM